MSSFWFLVWFGLKPTSGAGTESEKQQETANKYQVQIVSNQLALQMRISCCFPPTLPINVLNISEAVDYVFFFLVELML